MILCQSPHVEVNHNHGSVFASRAMVINTAPDTGKSSMIKRESASRKVAPSQGSRPGSARLFFPALPALGGKDPPGQLTSSAARAR